MEWNQLYFQSPHYYFHWHISLETHDTESGVWYITLNWYTEYNLTWWIFPLSFEREKTTKSLNCTSILGFCSSVSPEKEYSVTGNRRELITNAHKGLKHFSQFNSFSLLMANISNIALISGDLKFPRLPVKYQIYSFLSTLNTLHPCSCYELKIMFCLSSSHPMTPTTTGLHFQFRLCFSPKYYSSNSYKEVQPQIAELSLRFQQGLSNKQYVWLVSERRRIILILLSPSKAWKKTKIWSMCWQ